MEFPQFFLVMSGWFSGSSVSVISFFGERVYIYTYKYLSIHMYINIYTPIYIQCTRSQCRNYRNCRLGTFFAILRLGSCCGGCGRFGSPEADRLVHRRLRRNTAGRGKSSEPNSFFFFGSIRSSSGYIFGRSLKRSWHQHRSKHQHQPANRTGCCWSWDTLR